MKKILIMGLPGSGKTYFAERLKKYLQDNQGSTQKNNVDWFNADDVRRTFNDWDFSTEGRIRQSIRMFEFANNCNGQFVICDFVAPLAEMRNNFKADWTIWMDTIAEGRYDDTNKVFVPPDVYDFRITEMDADRWVEFVGDHILSNRRRPVFDWKKETVQMLGRWQPWHKGHRALFEKAILKTGQVVIQIRDCQGWKGSNPFELVKVEELIRKDLDPIFQGQYQIQVVPNIVNITYGRDVGYVFEQELFDQNTHDISSTKIRKAMGLS